MNILPTDAYRCKTIEDIEQYFDDLQRWNFDVAYSAFYAFPHEKFVGELGDSYKMFAAKARELGIPSCVQIQSTVGFLDTPDLLEGAQYHLDNTPIIYEHHAGMGRKNFFGSYASPKWFEYVMNVARILREYGFEWVVFEEPMYRTDIPGSKDAFYKLFTEQYPNLEYPTKREESPGYLTLQAFKMDVLVDFYSRCCAESKKLGYSKAGIMPWFFTPTYENTPMESWTTSCDLGRITFIPDLDFTIVRMQPDNIWAEAMIASDGESLPRLVYLENIAQALGKPTIAVNNPTNEHVTQSQIGKTDLLDYDYFARYTLSATAAAPSGMSRHWYGKNYGEDTKHMDLYERCNPFLSRSGGPVSPVGFVFSYRSTVRVMPRPWLEIWRGYHSLASALLFEHKFPCLTHFADTLEHSLALHPETKVLILTPYFPVSEQEMKFLEKWVRESEDRLLLYLGADYGYTYDLNLSIYQWTETRTPEVLSLFGIDRDRYEPYKPDDRVTIKFTGKNGEMDSFLGPELTVRTCGIAKVKLTEPKPDVLYIDKNTREPVVVRRQFEGGGQCLYIGLSLDGIEPGLAQTPGCDPYPILRTITAHLSSFGSGDDFPLVESAEPGILWNETRAGYLIISNTWERKCAVELKKTDFDLWDCREEGWQNELEFKVKPLDFKVLKLVPKGSPVLDILNAVYLTKLEETEESTAVKGCFGKNFCVVSTCPPEKVLLNGEEIDWEIESIEVGWGVFPAFDSYTEGNLVFHWSEPRFEEMA